MVPLQNILLVLSIVGAVAALKCHLISYGSLTDPNAITTSTSLQDCPIGANSCVKTIDYSRNVFSKQCQIGNCTNAQGVAQAPANCFNNTNNGGVYATCCCYGDGCNSTPSHLPMFSSIIAVFASMLIAS